MGQKIFRKSLPAFITLTVISCLIFVTQIAGAIARSYATDDQELHPGMVAALSANSTEEQTKVERASIENEANIIGIATDSTDGEVAIVTEEKQIYVQISGEVDAYVSDINGAVKKGDQLVLSPLKGILMKISGNTARVVGIALEDFESKPAETRSINTDNGSYETKLAKLKINLDYESPSNQQVNTTDSSLGRLGRVITGKNIGEARILAALVIFLIVLIAEGGIIYGTVSSSISSLGRNPMAGKVILKEVVRVFLVALAVLALGVVAIYTILWL